jgi:PAP2 superfamily
VITFRSPLEVDHATLRENSLRANLSEFHRLVGTDERNCSTRGGLEEARQLDPANQPVSETRMRQITIPPTAIDQSIAKAAARHTNPLIQTCARAATCAADGKVLCTLVAAGWFLSRAGNRRQRMVSNHLARTAVVAVALPKLIKKVVDQERPDRCMVGPDRRGVGTSGNPRDSFPSGHSVHIGAMVSALSWTYPNKAPVFWLMGGSLALTRIAVLAHWASDVAAGWALGAGVEHSLRRLAK